MSYIATFYSHFGAIRFKKQCDSYGLSAKLMPVPRDLSSSCGTCVLYEGVKSKETNNEQDIDIDNFWNVQGMASDELEQIVKKLPEGYQVLYRAKEG